MKAKSEPAWHGANFWPSDIGKAKRQEQTHERLVVNNSDTSNKRSNA
jgi:hypothetical protein